MRRRGWAGAALVLSLLLAGMLGWRMFWLAEPLRPDAGPVRAPAAGLAVLSAQETAPAGMSPISAPPRAGTAPVPPVAGGQPAASPVDAELSQCQAQAAAARRASASAAVEEAEPPADAAALATAWEHTRRRLQSASQPLQQASALMMERPAPDLAATDANLPASALVSLVGLALASADPAVMQWAQRFCGLPGQVAACQGLSARAWAQAEPDNLMAWLELLRREPESLDEALQGMARSGRADSAYLRWVAVVLAARPPGLAPPVRVAFDVRLLGLGLTKPFPAWQALMSACRDGALADTRRRGQCGQIAQLLAEHSRDFMSASLGQGIGKRLGWPAERQREHQALLAAAQRQALAWLAPGQTTACQAALLEHQLLLQSQLGEVGLARQALKADLAASAASAASLARRVPR